MKIRTVLLGVSLVAAVVLAGCQTVKGVGKDITNASEATERAISK
ncbi:MAG: entericidin [Planctomycetota bacterium]|nr:entericidin [Planctomycetota bacterium]